jgi:isochorismate synthase
MDVTELIPHLFNKNLSAAVWCSPGEDINKFVLQKGAAEKTNALFAQRGFCVHAFNNAQGSSNFTIIPELEGEIDKYSMNTIFDFIQKSESITHTTKTPIEEDKSTYLQNVQKGIDYLKSSGEIKKFIYSRVKIVANNVQNIGAIFQKLTLLYPNALVYFFTHPSYGAWMGATPEVLLRGNTNRWQTTSLAATQAKNAFRPWNEKEIEEQSLVSEHIRNVCKNLKLPFSESDVYTHEAGPVVHLKSDFEIEANAALLNTFVDNLHPTPAVSGLPKEEAIRLISELEIQERGYYTGFLGWVENPNDFQLFVNLRCMQIFDNLLALRLGGGITARSKPESEWQETEHKAQTLLRAIS